MKRAPLRGVVVVVLAVGLVSVAGSARARDRVADADDASLEPKPEKAQKKDPELSAFDDKPGFVQLQGKALVGTGLRFNNPYRLPTALGDSAESVSRTAFYLDTGAAILFGGPTRFQHGLDLAFSFALEGIRQVVFTPSYVLARRKGPFAAALRIATPIVLTPSTTVGGELALSGTYFFRAALGVRAEVVGDVFYGAGTFDRAVPAYPMLSFALGLVVAWEALP